MKKIIYSILILAVTTILILKSEDITGKKRVCNKNQRASSIKLKKIYQNKILKKISYKIISIPYYIPNTNINKNRYDYKYSL